MSDIFTLTGDPDTTEAEVPKAPTDSSTPSIWSPGEGSTFSAPKPVEATAFKGKQKGSKKRQGDLPYVPLPEPKKTKKVSPKEQAKLDKAQLIKEREQQAAAMRINGVDGDIEIPKKPWLTIFNGKRASNAEVAETLTDLASMLENGESERAAVAALAEQYANYDIGQAYERVVMLLDNGVTLGEALADQTDSFPPVVRELVGAAKMPKDMHRNLRQASIIILEADNITSQVKSALFKPGFMLVFLMMFVIAAVQWLLPMTTSMFTGIGSKPPATTTLIISIGGWLKWVLLVVLILAAIFGLAWKVFLKNNEALAVRMDKLMINAPLVGDIIRMSTAARFSDVLSACLSVGMSELESLETAGRACGNRALSQWVEDHVGRQRYGIVNFGDVAKTEMLPWNFRNRIETTTSLTRRIEILRELALTFHEKARERLARFAERVGPITEGVVVIVVIVVVILIVSPILSFIPTLIKTVQS